MKQSKRSLIRKILNFLVYIILPESPSLWAWLLKLGMIRNLEICRYIFELRKAFHGFVLKNAIVSMME